MPLSFWSLRVSWVRVGSLGGDRGRKNETTSRLGGRGARGRCSRCASQMSTTRARRRARIGIECARSLGVTQQRFADRRSSSRRTTAATAWVPWLRDNSAAPDHPTGYRPPRCPHRRSRRRRLHPHRRGRARPAGSGGTDRLARPRWRRSGSAGAPTSARRSSVTSCRSPASTTSCSARGTRSPTMPTWPPSAPACSSRASTSKASPMRCATCAR